jgi:hypothetical protein
LQGIFGKEVGTHMNGDESFVIGACYYGKILYSKASFDLAFNTLTTTLSVDSIDGKIYIM